MKSILDRILPPLLVFAFVSTAWGQFDFGGGAAEKPKRVSGSLVVYEGGFVPGREANLGVLVDIQDGWKIQAGEGSGDEMPFTIPTEVTLTLPEGWSADQVRWPEAKASVVGEGEFAIDVKGYEKRSLFVIPVLVPESAQPGEYELSAEVHYQACDPNACDMPTSITIQGAFTVSEEVPADVAIDDEVATLFSEVLSRQPTTGQPDAQAQKDKQPGIISLKTAHWWIALLFVLAAMGLMAVRTIQITKSAITRGVVTTIAAAVSIVAVLFVLGMTSPPKFQWVYYDGNIDRIEQTIAEGENIVVAKFTAEWCANCHVNERIIMASNPAVLALQQQHVMPVKVDLTTNDAPGKPWLASLGGGGIPLIAVYLPGEETPVLIRGQLTSAQPIIDALSGKSISAIADDKALFDFLGIQFTVGREAVVLIFMLAFIAGFFMNFTPCVLPVVPLKILSLQAHAKEPSKCLQLGVIFSLGIVAFYAALGVLMAGLITGLERMDWGEFWGNWWLAALVGVIVGAMGLGMMGLFTIRLPQALYMFNPTSDTKSGSFFMGMFTAILSTPCTGPLLGATVAWLALQPAGTAFSTLVMMGAGMAFPYVLLTAKPSWLARLPRTGPGSELVKQIMGLLLLAVASFFIGIALTSILT